MPVHGFGSSELSIACSWVEFIRALQYCLFMGWVHQGPAVLSVHGLSSSGPCSIACSWGETVYVHSEKVLSSWCTEIQVNSMCFDNL